MSFINIYKLVNYFIISSNKKIIIYTLTISRSVTLYYDLFTYMCRSYPLSAEEGTG